MLPYCVSYCWKTLEKRGDLVLGTRRSHGFVHSLIRPSYIHTSRSLFNLWSRRQQIEGDLQNVPWEPRAPTKSLIRSGPLRLIARVQDVDGIGGRHLVGLFGQLDHAEQYGTHFFEIIW